MNLKLYFIPMMIAALSGCAPSYVSQNANTLTDTELCSRVGYAVASNDMEAAKTAYVEIKAREARKALTINKDDCKMYINFGIGDAREVAEKKQAIAQGLAQQQAYQQQQNLEIMRQRPVVTHCNALGPNLTCTQF